MLTLSTAPKILEPATPVTTTCAVAFPEPPVPVQVRMKSPDALIGPTDSDPDVALDPVHPPEAVQDVAFVDDQLSIVLLFTAIVEGVAVSVTVGAVPPLTVTVAFCGAEFVLPFEQMIE